MSGIAGRSQGLGRRPTATTSGRVVRVLTRMVAVLLASLAGSCLLAQESAVPDYSGSERDQVPGQFRWRVEDIYPDEATWRADLVRARFEADTLVSLLKDLTSSPRQMAVFLERYEKLSRLDAKLGLWPSLQHQTHLTDAHYQDLESEARRFSVDLSTVAASMDAAILALGEVRIQVALREEPRLEPYRAILQGALRKQGHVRSDEVEEAIAGVDLFGDGPGTAAYFLLNVDLPRPEAVLPGGTRVPLDRANRDRLLWSADPAERRAAHEAAVSGRKQFENTFAALADMSVKRDLFRARAHRFPDCLSAELFEYDVEPGVYRNLVESVRSNLEPYHRYLRLRARILGLKELHPYDAFLPAVPEARLSFTFDEARSLIEESTSPLGRGYAGLVREAFDGRWLDVYPHKDKAGLGSATSGYGVHPYVLLNYRGDFFELITVAHELGHAIAFAAAERGQPFATAQASWFLSEIPSTLNEVLLMQHLAAASSDDRTRLALLAEMVDRLSTLLFFSANGAEFELAIHEQVEGGGTLSAEWLNAKHLELARHYCGHGEGAMVVDDYVQTEWIHPNLFFAPFQSYFYVAGTVTSLAFAEEIWRGSDGAGERYLAFLEAGSSKPPSALLRDAGVDLGTPDAVVRALRVYSRLVDQLEVALDRLEK